MKHYSQGAEPLLTNQKRAVMKSGRREEEEEETLSSGSTDLHNQSDVDFMTELFRK
jgi:hypothetical protein